MYLNKNEKNETIYNNPSEEKMKTHVPILFIFLFLAGKNFAQPALTSPADGSEGVSTAPLIIWSSVPNANAYYLKVTTGNPQDASIFDGNVGNRISKKLSKLNNNTNYYVQLWSSTNGGTNWSPASANYSFKTEVYTAPERTQTAPVYNNYSQRGSNIKNSGIKAGIIFPIGSWSSDYGMGFTVADLTKWNISSNVRILGRMELTFFDGKEVKPYQSSNYSYITNPFGIITAGSGIEFSFDPDYTVYAIADFPSLNLIIMDSSMPRVGFGIGFGFETSWNKAVFDVAVRGNLYNAFLYYKSEESIAGIQLDFSAAF